MIKLKIILVLDILKLSLKILNVYDIGVYGPGMKSWPAAFNSKIICKSLNLSAFTLLNCEGICQATYKLYKKIYFVKQVKANFPLWN